MRLITFIILLTITSLTSFGQTASDAIRYSYWQYGGTARYMGVGGSMGALGGDYSAVISNPASLATYRRSEFTFTPGVLISGTDATFEGSTFSENRTSVNINEASLVFASAKPGKWKTVNFGIGYNKLADFSQQFNYTGTSDGSIADYFLELSQGLDPSQLSDYDNGLAYDTGLIYETSTNGVYENDLFPGDQTKKFQNIRNRGSMGEMNISIGGNMDHKLYVGGSIGIPFVNFSQTKTYQESDENGSIVYYDGLEYVESLTTSGVGVNINLGAIYRINQSIRVGAAFHSPTWITLSDSYTSTLDFNFTPTGGSSSSLSATPSEPGAFEYMQRTPMRIVGDLGVVIKKLGFVSAEVEWVDYSKNKYNFNSEFSNADDLVIENNLNTSIRNIYQSTVNIKAGAEFVLAKDYRVRAGYALFGSPYKNNNELFNGRQLSLGLGYRVKNYFIDVAYLHRTNSEFYQPYSTALGNPVIENDLSTDYILLTVGFKFGRR